MYSVCLRPSFSVFLHHIFRSLLLARSFPLSLSLPRWHALSFSLSLWLLAMWFFPSFFSTSFSLLPPPLHRHGEVLRCHYINGTCGWQTRWVPHNQSEKRWPYWSEMSQEQSKIGSQRGRCGQLETEPSHNISPTNGWWMAMPLQTNYTLIALNSWPPNTHVFCSDTIYSPPH